MKLPAAPVSLGGAARGSSRLEGPGMGLAQHRSCLMSRPTVLLILPFWYSKSLLFFCGQGFPDLLRKLPWWLRASTPSLFSTGSAEKGWLYFSLTTFALLGLSNLAGNFHSWVQIARAATDQRQSTDLKKGTQFPLQSLLGKPASLEGHRAEAQVM